MSAYRSRRAAEPDLRGSSYDRARRRAWMLVTYGDGVSCPCWMCGGELTNETVTADRVVPGSQGGRYTRDNIRPACLACNIARGDNGAEGTPWAETITAADLDQLQAVEYATPV